ncbi:hypothetical protein [Cerasicoccus maritimus]|uniref:hypothetical protein n=1 Tax=Cerasicoccus maritimus TaxID=490089 RepID=UPI002852D5B5|nr:hypothetical protein [Cerasicoccus maritimus]
MAILPVCPLIAQADRALDHDERFLWQRLSTATEALSSLSADASIRVLPTFQRVPDFLPDVVFGAELSQASQSIAEIATSVQRSNVPKLAFIHTNQSLGDWVDTIARELRVNSNLQAFNLFVDPNETANHPPLEELLREALAFPPITPFKPEASSDE